MDVKEILSKNLQPEKERLSQKDWELSSLISNLRKFDRKQRILRERTPVSYQGDLPSCTSNATCDAFEYITDNKTELSRLFVFWNSRTNKQAMMGTTIRSALDSLRVHGVCSEDLWPYDEKKVNIEPSPEAKKDAEKRRRTTYYRVRNQSEIVAAIDAGWPVIFSIPLDEDFLRINPGKDHVFEGNSLSNSFHAMIIVGYRFVGEECHFRVRNSWGKDWGDEGYCWFSSKYVMRAHQDCWAVTNYTPKEHLFSKRNVELAASSILTTSLASFFYYAADTGQLDSSIPGILMMVGFEAYAIWRRFKLNVAINDKMPFGQ